MRFCSAWMAVGLILGFFMPVGLASAGEPLAQIQDTTRKIMAILCSPELQAPEMGAERTARIAEVVGERFAWEETAKRALGPYWGQRSPEERKEFVDLFAKLLERNYIGKFECLPPENVLFLDEQSEGNYALVGTKLLTREDRREIPVRYRMLLQGQAWRVYDVSIEGVSLVNNYRTQFNSILVKSSFDELLRMLREKIAAAPGGE